MIRAERHSRAERSFEPAALRWFTAAVVVLVIVIHTAGRIGAYCSPLQNDSYIYSSFGYRIAHGDALYRDMSDIKPPGLFMLYALVYLWLPAGRASVAPVESFFLLAGYYAVYRAAAAMYGKSVALLVAVIAAVTINYFAVTGHVIEGFGLAESFMVLPAVAAFLFYRRAVSEDRMDLLVVAGVFLGLDASIKQTALPLIAAVALHWLWWAGLRHRNAVGRRSALRWLAGCAWLIVGACAAWIPFIAVMVHQETWAVALGLLTTGAGAMLDRGTGWPIVWGNVLPLWLPAAIITWGALAWLERWFRTRSPIDRADGNRDQARTPGDVRPEHPGRRGFVGSDFRCRRTPSTADLSPLCLWSAGELVLLCYLPLRSSHYYVATCIPIVLLTGAPLARFAAHVRTLSPRRRCAAWSMLVVGFAVFYRPTVDAIIPTAVARYRAFDFQADHDYFQRAIQWGHIHFGRGPAWVEPDVPHPAR